MINDRPLTVSALPKGYCIMTDVSRVGLIAFLLLGSAAVTNMLMLQPNGGRGSGARLAQAAAPSTASAPTVSQAGSQRPAADGRGPRSGAAGASSAAIEKDVAVRAATTPTRSGVNPDHRPEARSDVHPEHQSQTLADTQDVTKALQRELKARGYETGSADGQPGLMTRAAIMAYEHDRDMPLTGEPSSQLLKLVLLGDIPVSAATDPRARREQSAQATHVIRTVQQSLVTLGYMPGKIDGRPGEDTVRAIREFELDQGLPETGRVSGQLVARLARLAGQGRIATGGR